MDCLGDGGGIMRDCAGRSGVKIERSGGRQLWGESNYNRSTSTRITYLITARLELYQMKMKEIISIFLHNWFINLMCN